MLSSSGYYAMFWHFVQSRGYTHVQAYEACERTLSHYKMPERYSSYESFRVNKSKSGGKPDNLVSFW